MRNLFAWSCLLLMLGAATGVSAQRSSKKLQERLTAGTVLENLTNREYRINVTRVQPVGHQTVIPEPGYGITLRNGGREMVVELPYFGTGYNVPYGGGNGLRFTAPVEHYSEKPGKKGATDIILASTSSDNKKVSFLLTVYPNATAYLQVDADGLQTIYYSGAMDLRQ